jgi:hypothetical protein
MVKYGSPTRLRDHHVKRMIVEDVEQPHDRATFPGRPRVVDFTAFSAHNPFELGVSSEQIAAGFYTRLGSLQERNRTFYNGAAFHTHDSGLLWQFSDDQAVRSILSTAFRPAPAGPRCHTGCSARVRWSGRAGAQSSASW